MSHALDLLRSTVLATHSTLVNGVEAADPERLRVCAALGLVGEAAEFSELIKKNYEQARVLDRDKAILELGDVAYYLQLACFSMDVTLEEVIAKNRVKLQKRFPEGFDAQAAVKRVDCFDQIKALVNGGNW